MRGCARGQCLLTVCYVATMQTCGVVVVVLGGGGQFHTLLGEVYDFEGTTITGGLVQE